MRGQLKKKIGPVAVLLLLAILAFPALLVHAVPGDDSHTVTAKVDEGCQGYGWIDWKGENKVGDKCADKTSITVTATANPGYEFERMTCLKVSTGTETQTNESTWNLQSVEDDLVFVAYFKKKEFGIVYKTDPPTVTLAFDAGVTKPDTYVYGDSITLPIPIPDSTAYSFDRWLLNGTSELPGNVLSLGSAVDVGTNTITLTAVFTPNSFQVKQIDWDPVNNKQLGIFYFMAPYGSTVSGNGSFLDDANKNLVYQGYTYDLEDPASYTSLQVTTNELTNIVYRYYMPNTYTVTLNPGEDAATPGAESLTVTFNQAFPQLSAAQLPTRIGYTFAGYYLEPDGRGKQYIDKDGNGQVWDVPMDTTLYAYWTPNAYTVAISDALMSLLESVTMNGESYTGTPLSFKFGETVTILVTAKDGYKLVAWQGDSFAHAKQKTFSFTIPAQDSVLDGTVLPVCSVPAWRIDYERELLILDIGSDFIKENYILRCGSKTVSFNENGEASVSDFFGMSAELIVSGDGVATADSDPLSVALVARPAAPTAGEGGTVGKPTKGETTMEIVISEPGSFAYEFAVALRASDKLTWVDSGSFTDLKSGTMYLFYVRVKASDTYPHGEALLITESTLNDRYLSGKIEELRGNLTDSDGVNVKTQIEIYISKMQDLPASANYEEEIDALIRECLGKLTHARAQDAGIAEINRIYEELSSSKLYDSDGKAALTALRDASVEQINEAVTPAGVDEIRRTFDLGLNQIPIRYIYLGDIRVLTDLGSGIHRNVGLDRTWLDDFSALSAQVLRVIQEGRVSVNGDWIALSDAQSMLLSLDTVGVCRMTFVYSGTDASRPAGPFEVRLMIPDSLRGKTGLQVAYYLSDTSELRLLDTRVDGEYLVFVTDTLADFVILSDRTVDLSMLILALGLILLLQIVSLVILLVRRTKYVDRVKYAQEKSLYTVAFPVLALTIRFLPEKSLVIAIILGTAVVVLQAVIMVLIFRSSAIAPRKKHTDGSGEEGSSSAGDGDSMQNAGGEEPAAPVFAPQVSVFRDDDTVSFEPYSAENELQEEDWYEDTPAGEEEPDGSFEPDDSDDADDPDDTRLE